MSSEEDLDVSCPYCGEFNRITDLEGESPGILIIDCQCCCRPMACEWDVQSGQAVILSVQPA